MRKIEIEVWGDTEYDKQIAMEEAERNIAQGCLRGGDSNDTGGYYFNVTNN